MGPFNSHRAGGEGWLADFTERKKIKKKRHKEIIQFLVSVENLRKHLFLKGRGERKKNPVEMMKMSDNCFPSQRFIMPRALSEA